MDAIVSAILGAQMILMRSVYWTLMTALMVLALYEVVEVVNDTIV